MKKNKFFIGDRVRVYFMNGLGDICSFDGCILEIMHNAPHVLNFRHNKIAYKVRMDAKKEYKNYGLSTHECFWLEDNLKRLVIKKKKSELRKALNTLSSNYFKCENHAMNQICIANNGAFRDSRDKCRESLQLLDRLIG